jgi:hypothetical protein
MNRRAAAAVLLGLSVLPALAIAAEFRPFRSGSYAGLLAARRGEPLLLVVWSVTCAPCRQEFELLRDLRAQHPEMPLVLLSTDDIADSDLAGRMLAEAGLAGEESWIFAGDPQRLRYEIDPAHRRKGVSGSLARATIEDWLARTAPAR